ncbi:MAG: hypothetical protein CVU43_24405 [Chloroflexi bacterium HGW-Chloroflexi-5]|jgi:hypothetical protein|nr:MAG: hypothetical protein CVU43_24405 [Chloroflexi bacterium HGW-Chloroflexi-5]
MKKHRSKVFFALLMIFCFSTAFSQEATVVSGGNASGSGGSVSYSVGQIDYQAPNGSSGVITEGIQQPYEIFEIEAIDEAGNISLSVYPNPTVDFLTLEINDFDLSTLSFRLSDIQGKVLLEKEITESKSNIPMENLTSATYFLTVSDKNGMIKTFKIIKN